MIRLAVRCRPELAERVLAELVELAPSGIEERRGDGFVELAIYAPPGELPALPELEATAGDALIEVTSTEVADDWAERWREFHEPVSIADERIVVRPPWSAAAPGREAEEFRAPAAPGREAEEAAGIDVQIDPGRAFGTGAHATTRMCLELLLELAGSAGAHGPLVDLGTGSGVLAIAAAKLGWSPVVGVDSEVAALDAASLNAEANGVELELRRVNLRRDAPPIAATTVANLTAPLLVELAAALRTGPVPRALLCSGLLATEAERVAAAYERAGLVVAERRVSGEWAALRLACDSDPPSG